MEISSDLLNAPKEFLRLFKAGKEAAKQGDRARAHELFRQAIEVDPYHEQVWLWLASVVETDEDRRVCFENVLQLNPANPMARRQLQKIEERELEAALSSAGRPRKGVSRRRRLFRLLMIVLIAVAVAVAAWAWEVI